jgi:hypothetical protein
MGEGVEGGPGLPSGEQDKQSICSSGGDKMSMGEPGGQPDGLNVTSRPHHTGVCNIVYNSPIVQSQ